MRHRVRRELFWLGLRWAAGSLCQFCCGCSGRLVEGTYTVSWNWLEDRVCRRHAVRVPYRYIWASRALYPFEA